LGSPKRLFVAVEVGDGHGCSQRRDVRLDAGDLWIEGRPVVHEVYAGSQSLVAQHKSRVRSVRGSATRPTIESHREQQCSKKRHGNDRASNCWGSNGLHRGDDTRPFTTRVSYSRR
jgi:hypothetical protein